MTYEKCLWNTQKQNRSIFLFWWDYISLKVLFKNFPFICLLLDKSLDLNVRLSHISNCHHQPLHQMLRLMLLWWLFGVRILQFWGRLILVRWSIPLAALWADFRVSITLTHRCFPTVKQREQAKDTIIKIVFSLNLGQDPSSCFSLLPHMQGVWRW